MYDESLECKLVKFTLATFEVVAFGFVKFAHAPLKGILVSGKTPDGFQSNTCNDKFKMCKKMVI